jgi:protein phosphatase
MKIAFAALTDVGLVRQNNEDTFLVLEVGGATRHTPPPASAEGSAETDGRGLLVAVADGMGGALAGEVASSMAVESLCDVADELAGAESDEAARELILTAIGRANERIFEASQANPDQRGMGTTLTAALVRRGHVQFFQVGDSKGFLGRQGKLHLMTKDHSLIGQLVADKVISPEDAEQLEGGRNIILKALGAEASVKIDCSDATLDEGDMLLLCTDGLHGCVRDSEIEEMLEGSADAGKLGEDLVREARDRGGPDNITVVTVTVIDSGEMPRTPGLLGRITGMFKPPQQPKE